MNISLKEIWKHIRVYLFFIKNCVVAQLEFRFNFVTNILVEIGYTFAAALYGFVVYKSGVHFVGLPPQAIFLFVGTYILMNGVYVGLFLTNFMSISSYIREGGLDFIITKPVSLQFMATLRYVNVAMPIPNVVAGLAMIVYAWNQLHIPISMPTIGLYVLMMVCSVVLTYCVTLIPQIFTFWLINSSAVTELSHAIWDFNNMPMTVYGKWIQRVGIFLFPLFIISNFPPMVLLQNLSALYIVWGGVAAILFLYLTRKLWLWGLKNYSSASS
ncbi:ABC-2 family transporter protein [Paenibacillus athensensis]|uniref:ABC transporter permease n=1 Tax=Paenibacillus athensensis TaxID=1967502 RepID=A0A4Y8PXT7_9BACL|nr:ABC-2 family transporter protein [Paenibacillus athensensis]MCD1259365.1 ABC-2 family transporter protein [Paenibacillus athensensis]